VKVPAGEAPPPLPSALPNPHDVDGQFLVEVYFRTVPGKAGAALVSDLDGRGYELGLDGAGLPVFVVRAGAETVLTGPAPLHDGKWHHLVAEADRAAGQIRLYVDGRAAAGSSADLAGSMRNGADLLVGKGASGAHFAGSIEFLRIALGTLADAKTTIEELYAWQFDGPFLRDFAGRAPAGARRDAGALEGAP
jgi:hypothetical protein